jgi:acyl carrier protein
MAEHVAVQLADRITLIAEIVARIMRDPSVASQITGETDLLDEIAMDSLDVTELILCIEDEIGYQIDFDQLGAVTFRNVRELAKITLTQSAAWSQ